MATLALVPKLRLGTHLLAKLCFALAFSLNPERFRVNSQLIALNSLWGMNAESSRYRALTNQRSDITLQIPLLAHVAEWQTRTAQDRMGKPVEVQLLS